MFIKECIGDLCHLPGIHPLAMFSGGSYLLSGENTQVNMGMSVFFYM